MSSEALPNDPSPGNFTKMEPPALSISSALQRGLVTTEAGSRHGDSDFKGLAATVSKR